MAAEFSIIARVQGGAFDRPATTVSIETIGTAAGLRLAVADYTHGATTYWNVAGTGGAQRTGIEWHLPAERVSISLEHRDGSLAQTAIDTAMAAWQDGMSSGQLAYLAPGALQADSAIVLGAQLNGQDLLFVAERTGDGIASFVLDAQGRPSAPLLRIDSSKHYLDNVADMAVAQTATGNFLFAGSSSEHGISSYRIGTNGALAAVDHMGRSESLPIQSPSAIEVAEIAGRLYVIAAASGSSSLSVLKVSATGALSAVDQVIDSQDTRFANATQLDVVTVQGHVFVLAAGSDDGLSLFELSPSGRLVYLDTIVDGVNTPLAGLSGLAGQAVAGGIEILTTSANEAGGAHLGIGFDTPGLVRYAGSGALSGSSGDDMLELAGAGTISGGAGDDILLDGAGANTLSGGAGRDVFVMRGDGAGDVITDIQVGLDRLDLSDWGFLYSTDQLALQSTAWGGVLRYGDEVLSLKTANGASLTAEDIAALVPVMPQHVEITTGALQQAAPEADPDPFPDTVPGPDPMPAPEPAPEPDPIPEPPATEVEDSGIGRWMSGDSQENYLVGGSGNDSILGRDGDDVLLGGAGNDEIAASNGNDYVRGGAGHDNIGGGWGDDTLMGDDGYDTVGGGPGDDIIRMGAGNDVASGGAGRDLVEGEDGNDVLAGSFDADTVLGGAGDDQLGGGTGADWLDGGTGNDRIGGGEDNDTLIGGGGHDYLGGAEGDDVLNGGDGRDTLNGGDGDDRLYGGAGPDVFLFNALTGGGTDIIQDFEDGLDLLRLVGEPLPGQNPLGALNLTDTVIEGQGAVQLGYGNYTLYLMGVSTADLSAEDFLFT